MIKIKKAILFIFLPVILIALPALADLGMEHAHADLLPEESPVHIILMSILVVIIMISFMISWNCAIFFGGRMGKGFQRIAIGFGILSLAEIFNIFNHLGWVISESIIEHLIKIIAFIIIAAGFQAIITARTEKK